MVVTAGTVAGETGQCSRVSLEGSDRSSSRKTSLTVIWTKILNHSNVSVDSNICRLLNAQSPDSPRMRINKYFQFPINNL